jgi:thiamine-monophosphate kinase
MTGDSPAGARSGPDPTLRELGEDALVASVVSRFGAAPAWLRVPPGDDAAVIDLPAVGGTAALVTAIDSVVEGLDFRRDWSSGTDVGVKVAAQNLADLAAMGAVPMALLVSLAAPPELPSSWTTGLADGLAAECARAGAHVVGGDVSAAEAVLVTGTGIGVLAGAPAVLRSGARPGDLVAIAGSTGLSAAGLALLQAGWRDERGLPGLDPAAAAAAVRMVSAHRRPQPHYPAGPAAAAAGATAMIDTSDGLLRDAGRVARASGVRLDLDPQAVEPTADLVVVAAALGVDPLGWVLGGGEDHALLACFPAELDSTGALPAGFRVIGAVHPAGSDGPAVLVGGRAWTGDPGWQHFR